MRRRCLTILLIGLGCVALVLAGGWALQRVWRGADVAATRVHIEADVRETFDAMARRLQRAARLVATDRALGPTIDPTIDGEPDAARRLFQAIEAIAAEHAGTDFAITVYAADGRPLAWAGRPSDLPADRLQGNGVWFLARGSLGLRLVYVVPVLSAGSRVATIAAERAVVPTAPVSVVAGLRGPSTDQFTFPTAIAPVSIDLPVPRQLSRPGPDVFTVDDPSGQELLVAHVSVADIVAARRLWRTATVSIAIMVAAFAVVLLTGPLLDWRRGARRPRPYLIAVVLTAGVTIIARLLLRLASPAEWTDLPLVTGVDYASSRWSPLLASPLDFLATSLTGAALVGLLLFAVRDWRLQVRRRRRPVTWSLGMSGYLGAQALAGVGLAVVLRWHDGLIADTIAHSTIDLLHFARHPWEGARMALQVGLIVANAAALGLMVAILMAALIWWRVPRRDWRLTMATAACWGLPVWALLTARGGGLDRQLPLYSAAVAVMALAWYATRISARYRHGSQAFRLTLLTLGLVLPALACYPMLFVRAADAQAQLVETRYAREAIDQRQTVQMQLAESLEQIDAYPNLAALVSTANRRVVPASGSTTASPTAAAAESDRAYRVWRKTALATYPVTSSVELYDASGALVSRFAFNLPEDLTSTPRSDERACDWDVYEEVAPFFAEERRALHAGRALCTPDGTRLGSVVVHAILDYENLPFIASENPYLEVLRPVDPRRGDGVSGGDVAFAFYGWSGRPLFSSRETAWPLDAQVLARLVASRMPFWARVRQGGQAFNVYLLTDRGGIYALGVPRTDLLDHLVNLAELTVLATGTYALLLIAAAVFGWISHRRITAPALLREVRASFYRKLFIAFVFAVILPVTALAIVTRNYVADQMRTTVEQDALRTAATARRVIEDLVAPRAAERGIGVDDNLMVWVSRLIDQDVNVFVGPQLAATSERNLFASGLLPTRTPADVYHALTLGHDAASVTREHLGPLHTYLVAGTPLTIRSADAVLTVPMTSREQDIEDQIDTLDRRVLLGALLFILAGAALGYKMAERISDPVNRLTRATRRIARGDLTVRVAASSSDELRRLVDDFNSMAADLQRQRVELERTHRLEAWAEMARQVAHDIKNPLTPIQLNAEHLRRVHADRGEPLSPVLEQCVATILSQVTLLRQIASEFSSFASSPTARPAALDLSALLLGIVDPYRAALEPRITFDVDVSPHLTAYADRVLIARALTNLIENALHAMPGDGHILIVASAHDHGACVRIADTGIGMDDDALARAFEPYFSTKVTGTGLGLPIAKRNVEMSGGTIAISSTRGHGTTVEITLPAAPP